MAPTSALDHFRWEASVGAIRYAPDPGTRGAEECGYPTSFHFNRHGNTNMFSQDDIHRRTVLAAMAGFGFGILQGCRPSSSAPVELIVEPEPVLQPLDLPVPLLLRLHDISDRSGERFYEPGVAGLGTLGLNLARKLENGDYWCTPKNTLKFANTAGDGVHFSLVQIDGKVTEDSPVVMSVPANSGNREDANLIMGSSLINFIRFGLRRGYFYMEQWIYQRENALKAYASAEWRPEDPQDREMYEVDETSKRILEFLAQELNVTPLTYTVDEFEALQNRYKPLLKF